MLILNLAGVARGPVRLREEIAPDDPIWEGAGITFAGPLRVELEASSLGEAVLVRGEIEGRIATECRRCLAAVEVTLRDTVDLLFERLTPAEAEDLGGEVLALPERGDNLDLGPAIREQLLLRVPEHVVCKESCRGLCPQCGAELNREVCDCVPAADEGPWSALKKIRFD